MNLGTIISNHAQFRSNHTALIFGETELTWLAFNKRVNRLANTLIDLGIKKNDKVATILPNCLEILEIYMAVAKIGAVVVPLSPLLRGQGLVRLINDSDSIIVFTNHNFVDHLTAVKPELENIKDDHFVLTDADDVDGYQYYHQLVSDSSDMDPTGININRDDPYNIIYSSGTTGLPKGIVHTHYVRMMYCTLFASAYRMSPESIVLHTGALVFNGAFLTLMPAMYLGAKYILHSHFDAENLIETVAREKVTHIMVVPSQVIAILNALNYDPKKLESLEMICTVGAPLLLDHKTKLMNDLPDRFYELYGLTEGFVTILDKTVATEKPASVGSPPPFFEMRIVDSSGNDLPPNEIGEIVGRGPILMAGYYKRPDLTQNAIRDGWLYSGDLGYVDVDGYLYLVDRKKDMIISGGVNVYPRDIEEIIAQHPDVQEVAVFGVPHDTWGETPVAAVILMPDSNVSSELLLNWINERIEARFQKVSRVLVMDDFPRSAAGKTLKRTIRDGILDESD